MSMVNLKKQEEDEEIQMTSLSMFLQSSANTEMVYSILTGITKFALLNFLRDGMTAEQTAEFKRMEYRVDKKGDTTITLRRIKINNVKQWEKVKKDDLRESMSIILPMDLRERSKSVAPFDRRKSVIKLGNMGQNHLSRCYTARGVSYDGDAQTVTT